MVIFELGGGLLLGIESFIGTKGMGIFARASFVFSGGRLASFVSLASASDISESADWSLKFK